MDLMALEGHLKQMFGTLILGSRLTAEPDRNSEGISAFQWLQRLRVRRLQSLGCTQWECFKFVSLRGSDV